MSDHLIDSQSELLTWLHQQIDEDERIALATTPVPVPGRWKAAREKYANAGAPLALIQGDEEDEPGDAGYSYGHAIIAHVADWQHEAEDNLRHIARHDPARILAEVAAKRQILGDILDTIRENERLLWSDRDIDPDMSESLLRAMASAYADRPGYKTEWSLT